MLESGYDFEHGGLAGAVFADQRDFVALVDHIIDIVE